MTDDLSNSLAGVSSLLTAPPEVRAGAWVMVQGERDSSRSIKRAPSDKSTAGDSRPLIFCALAKSVSMLVRAYLVFLVMAVLTSAARGAELEHCPVTENGQAVELAIEKAASCERAMETFRACAYAASGDVQLGAAVIRRCEADFLNKLSRRQKRTYHQELKRCWLKYGRQSGTIYRSFEAMCAAGVAQAYSRTFQKAGGRKKSR